MNNHNPRTEMVDKNHPAYILCEQIDENRRDWEYHKARLEGEVEKLQQQMNRLTEEAKRRDKVMTERLQDHVDFSPCCVDNQLAFEHGIYIIAEKGHDDNSNNGESGLPGILRMLMRGGGS